MALKKYSFSKILTGDEIVTYLERLEHWLNIDPQSADSELWLSTLDMSDNWRSVRVDLLYRVIRLIEVSQLSPEKLEELRIDHGVADISSLLDLIVDTLALRFLFDRCWRSANALLKFIDQVVHVLETGSDMNPALRFDVVRTWIGKDDSRILLRRFLQALRREFGL